MSKFYLFYCYIPESHLEVVKKALFTLGLGSYEYYSHCSWQVKGLGQFKPLDGSHPFIGSKDKVEITEEWRVEMICPLTLKDKAVAVFKNVHPYEEPAFGFMLIET